MLSDPPTLNKLKSAIDWKAPNAHDAVVRLLHDRVLEYAVAYQEGGNASLAVYRNKSKPETYRPIADGPIADCFSVGRAQSCWWSPAGRF